MPFITEAIWARLPHEPGDPDLLIVADWPEPSREQALSDPATGAAVEALIDLVRAIRNARAEAGIEAGAFLEADLVLSDSAVRTAFTALAEPLGRLARIRPVRVHAAAADLPPAADGGLVVIAAAGEARLSRAGADLERERGRLERELDDARRLLTAAEDRAGERGLRGQSAAGRRGRGAGARDGAAGAGPPPRGAPAIMRPRPAAWQQGRGRC